MLLFTVEVGCPSSAALEIDIPRTSNKMEAQRQLVTLGMFIIDEFEYLDEDGQPTGHALPPQGSL